MRPTAYSMNPFNSYDFEKSILSLLTRPNVILSLCIISMIFSCDVLADNLLSSSAPPGGVPSNDVLSSKNPKCANESALSTCVSPSFNEAYYIEQSVLYFRTMESKVSPFVQPNYAKDVIRWEWPPWLWLTGYGRFNLIWTDVLLKLFPTAYNKLDCKAFSTQPFGRCHVVFNYGGHLCPIYEEFTFNEKGQITFIEAWSDYPSLLPMPVEDQWAQGEQVSRIANKVPGLGFGDGNINGESSPLIEAAKYDSDLANLLGRLRRPYSSYFKTIKEHEGELLAGCDAPVPSVK